MKNKNTSVEVVGTTNPTPQENNKGTANGELPNVINWGDVERHEANAMSEWKPETGTVDFVPEGDSEVLAA